MTTIKELIEEWKGSFNDVKEVVIRDLEIAQEYHKEQMNKFTGFVKMPEGFISKADVKQAIGEYLYVPISATPYTKECFENQLKRFMKKLGISEEVKA